jgi:hypothetical protein
MIGRAHWKMVERRFIEAARDYGCPAQSRVYDPTRHASFLDTANHARFVSGAASDFSTRLSVVHRSLLGSNRDWKVTTAKNSLLGRMVVGFDPFT